LREQRGFSLAELVIAIAVTGIITGFLGTAIYQMLSITSYGNDRLTATHELQNAAHWFNLDGQRAVSADTNGGLELTISETTSITYTLSGTELRRISGASQMTLAKNISSAAFSVDNRLITMSLTSAPEGQYDISTNGTYKVLLRPMEEG
jgi:prepilin-type N-terminal cleavage/methylation domain-containing protein